MDKSTLLSYKGCNSHDNKLVVDITVQKIGKFLVPNRSELFYLLAFLKQNEIFQSFVSVFDTQT